PLTKATKSPVPLYSCLRLLPCSDFLPGAEGGHPTRGFSGYPTSPPLLIHLAGISNRHLIRSEAKTCSILPPSSNGISSRIMPVPYPFWLGVRPGGPPVSSHSMTSPSCDPLGDHRHWTDTRPVRLEKAPYFAAFVVSS